MMYTIAAVKGIEALAIMTVSDLLGESGDTVGSATTTSRRASIR